MHTKEPWKVSDAHKTLIAAVSEIGVHFRAIASVDTCNKGNDEYTNSIVDENKANAARIVACVNACAGISNEALESGLIGELVVALENIIVLVENDVNDYGFYGSYKNAKKVLSKVRGER